MIKTENLATKSGKRYIYNYSDSGMMIERDGILYYSAIDPADSGRTYTESDQPIEQESEEA